MKKSAVSNEQQNNRQEKTLKVLCIILSVIFCLVIAAVPIYFAFSKDKEMSESENRVLAKRPDITLSSLVDGSFMKSFESWLSDQFPFRDKIISLKTSADRIVGKKEENEVYFGSDGFLFEKQSEYDEEKVKSITNAINEFCRKNEDARKAVAISPNSSSVLSEYLPKYVTESNQKKELSKIETLLTESTASWINCAEAFGKTQDKTKLFYHTDHHWTTLAAFDVFNALMETWEFDVSKTQFDFYTVTSDFQGTLASSSGSNVSTDEIQICTPNVKNSAYIVSYEESGKKTATFFEKEKLETKNKYEVFLGGNYDKVVVTTNTDTNDTLLIFKDSYANCMIPMFTPFFSKIVVIDPRYYSDSLQNIMDENDFTHILFLYNLNTFLEDTSLEGLLCEN